jgi:hypothetical protein
VQTAKISELERRLKALEKDKAELTKQRDSALKDVEGTYSRSTEKKTILIFIPTR